MSCGLGCGSNEIGFWAVIFCFECGEREREKREREKCKVSNDGMDIL